MTRPLIPAKLGNGETFLLEPSENRIHLSCGTALYQFLEAFGDPLVVSGLGEHLTCRETEALADVLAAHDYHPAADALRFAHLDSDDAGDLDHNTLERLEG